MTNTAVATGSFVIKHNLTNIAQQVVSLTGICVLLSGGLQSDSVALHLFSRHQLLLDPGGGPLPPQSHLHGLPIRQQIPLGFYIHWMG